MALQSLGQAAVMVLARQAAMNLVKDELRRKGQRMASMRELHIAADELLRQRPELIEQAMARAWRIALTNQQGRIAKALFDDERRAAHLSTSQKAPDRAPKSLEKMHNSEAI
jgi:hypothetical protein